MTPTASPPASVPAFFTALKHPLTPTLRATCTAIRTASPRISEGIKWNAPSYYVGNEQYFATVNIHGRGKASEHVLVVLHRGAKAKSGKVKIADPHTLIDWLSPDRGAIRFTGPAEVRKRAPALKAIVRQWITQL